METCYSPTYEELASENFYWKSQVEDLTKQLESQGEAMDAMRKFVNYLIGRLGAINEGLTREGEASQGITSFDSTAPSFFLSPPVTQTLSHLQQPQSNYLTKEAKKEVASTLYRRAFVLCNQGVNLLSQNQYPDAFMRFRESLDVVNEALENNRDPCYLKLQSDIQMQLKNLSQ